jgi:hypothetical protein
LAEQWNGATWSIQPSANGPGPEISGFNGVSCASATACTAVGSSGTQDDLSLLADHWDGTSWSMQDPPTPEGAVSSDLDRVSCPTATFCAAVGSYETKPDAPMPLTETWNGTSWSIQPTPDPSATLNDVSCTSASDCTAAGDRTDSVGPQVTLVEHWDGTGWSIEPTPNPPPGNSPSLGGVSCTSATACTAVGYSFDDSSYLGATLAERWNGTSWTIQSTPNKATYEGFNVLNAVSCASETVCTAVGYWQEVCDVHTGPCLPNGLAERWDGTSWTSQHINHIPGGAPPLAAVSCPSTTNCTATTDALNYLGTATGTTTNWTIQALNLPPVSIAALTDISCASTTVCTAVGSDFPWEITLPLVLRYS